MKARFHVGDRLLFRQTAYGPRPDPLALRFEPAVHGEFYASISELPVELVAWTPEGRALLRFQDGRTVDVRADSDCLREPFLWSLLGLARRLRGRRTRRPRCTRPGRPLGGSA